MGANFCQFITMNVYEMYYQNDKNFGFWIKRNSWGNSIEKKYPVISHIITIQKFLLNFTKKIINIIAKKVI